MHERVLNLARSPRGLLACWIVLVASFGASAIGSDPTYDTICWWDKGGNCDWEVGCMPTNGSCDQGSYQSGYYYNLSYLQCELPYLFYMCWYDPEATPAQKCAKAVWWTQGGCTGRTICPPLYAEYPQCKQQPYSHA